jgi:hypothetical protein
VTGQIFISHDPAEASAYVDGLSRFLAASGLAPFTEKEIGGEQRWAQVVEAIRGCAAMVVVMTPGAERSPWLTSQVSFALDLGKPILPLLLGGTGFASFAQLPAENVTTGAMPSAAFVTRLRSFVPPLGVSPASGPAVAPPNSNGRRVGMIIGIAAAAVVGVLVLALAAGALLIRTYGNQQPKSWQDRAAAIPGIHNYLASNPEWFAVGPQGNHRRGLITYPVSPPVGGLHNPFWQNCMGDVYDAEIPREQAMHSLEHGALWVTYRPDLPKAQADRLAARVNGVPYLFMSPYPALDAPISLQAWGYQLKLDNASDKRIDDFIGALRINASVEPGLN